MTHIKQTYLYLLIYIKIHPANDDLPSWLLLMVPVWKREPVLIRTSSPWFTYNCSTSNTSIYAIVWIKIYPVNDIIIDQEFCCLLTVIGQSNCPGKHVYPCPWCKERTQVRVIGISNVCYHRVESKNVVSNWRWRRCWLDTEQSFCKLKNKVSIESTVNVECY